jgi:hypothetical protein
MASPRVRRRGERGHPPKTYRRSCDGKTILPGEHFGAQFDAQQEERTQAKVLLDPDRELLAPPRPSEPGTRPAFASFFGRRCRVWSFLRPVRPLKGIRLRFCVPASVPVRRFLRPTPRRHSSFGAERFFTGALASFFDPGYPKING